MIIKKLINTRINKAFMTKGDMKYIALNTLSKKPMHGYQLINTIKESFMDLYTPSPGMMYPILKTLEAQGLIKGKGRHGKKTYNITDKGEKHLKENKTEITRITDAIRNNEHMPQIKKIANDLQELAKETINLATTRNNDESIKETREILADAIRKIREAWRE